MTNTALHTAAVAGVMLITAYAPAQWITFTDQTAARLPTGAGQNEPNLTTKCPEEKDYTWGDVDHDGDIDLICVRKRPLECEGGRRNLLLMNENGVLIDRAATLASAAIGVPPEQGVSQGFLDATNDRMAALVDVNNDGWLDIVTAVTMSDQLPRYLGHPRVYMNLGEAQGVWQGFRYEYDRFPQLLSKTGLAWNPRFSAVAAGDVTGDGFVDLYFGDVDTPEAAYCPLILEIGSWDMDNKLLVNQGAANPGYFVDEGVERMGAALLAATSSPRNMIVDTNGDGIKDVVKLNTLTAFLQLSVLVNPPASVGYWNTSSQVVVYSGNPFNFDSGDLNSDGRFDLVISDDGNDRYSLNNTNPGNNPSFTHLGLTSEISTDGVFSGADVIVDLDNDGRRDAIVADQNDDTNWISSRRTRIYRNQGPGAPAGQLLRELAPPVLPIDASGAKSVYNLAAFDINGDGWRDIVLGRGGMTSGSHNDGSTQVWISQGKPALAFIYPQGQPTNLLPNTGAIFQVQLTGLTGGVPLADSAVMHLSVNGAAFAPTDLTSLGSDLYEAVIPAQNCPASVRYYFSGQLVTGGTFVDPPGAPGKFHSVAVSASTSIILDENFEGAASGWTVQSDGSLTSGAWEVGDVTNLGTWYEGLKAAPDEDATLVGVRAFVTGLGTVGGALGDADVDGGPTHLVSPALNLSGANAGISFRGWFYSSTPGDVLQVAVSNDDGNTWTTVTDVAAPPIYNWNAHSAEYVQTAWMHASFNVSDYVTPTGAVRVRFTANDIAPAGFVEAGIDDVLVTRLNCSVNPCPADVNGNGSVNIADLLAVIAAWGPCAGCAADVNGSGTVDIADLLLVIAAWGECQ